MLGLSVDRIFVISFVKIYVTSNNAILPKNGSNFTFWKISKDAISKIILTYLSFCSAASVNVVLPNGNISFAAKKIP